MTIRKAKNVGVHLLGIAAVFGLCVTAATALGAVVAGMILLGRLALNPDSGLAKFGDAPRTIEAR